MNRHKTARINDFLLVREISKAIIEGKLSWVSSCSSSFVKRRNIRASVFDLAGALSRAGEESVYLKSFVFEAGRGDLGVSYYIFYRDYVCWNDLLVLPDPHLRLDRAVAELAPNLRSVNRTLTAAASSMIGNETLNCLYAAETARVACNGSTPKEAADLALRIWREAEEALGKLTSSADPVVRAFFDFFRCPSEQNLVTIEGLAVVARL